MYFIAESGRREIGGIDLHKILTASRSANRETELAQPGGVQPKAHFATSICADLWGFRGRRWPGKGRKNTYVSDKYSLEVAQRERRELRDEERTAPGFGEEPPLPSVVAAVDFTASE